MNIEKALFTYLQEHHKTSLTTFSTTEDARFEREHVYERVEELTKGFETATRRRKRFLGQAFNTAYRVATSATMGCWAGMVRSLITNEPMQNAVFEGAIYTGATAALLSCAHQLSSSLLKEVHSVGVTLSKEATNEQRAVVERLQNALTLVVNTNTDPELASRLKTLDYLQNPPPQDSKVAHFIQGSFAYAIIAIPAEIIGRSLFPALSVIVGGGLENSFTKSMSAIIETKRRRTFNQEIGPLTQLERKQLAAGLIHRWYDEILRTA
ncbi:hypothetical protein HN592_04710 [Candidatus Woesearchaeota archaeon]|jgi:hypothetical protein|nr:hypothetical protein [Candidatus Woesearchaeota archaeon]MBT4368514.1 hypothetical protein [Candidatus Woesearchaeota archaeon]MBT4713003.1 hypothetical protein [Candidatus Woesearchaeota archaeon]MBT6639915.1 hypothetical protein [Candidatus Woesearchaeota archaeon]MBT7134087.1 hypothetical protein [Candidatus Woesearchaeota archaeon]